MKSYGLTYLKLVTSCRFVGTRAGHTWTSNCFGPIHCHSIYHTVYNSNFRGIKFYPINEILFWNIIIIVILLTWIGARPVSPQYYGYDKTFLVADHRSLSIRAWWKVLDLAYNRTGTRTGAGVKFLCRSPWIHELRPRKLYTSAAVTPAPFRVSTQWSPAPIFTSAVV